jgi:hypothetical protein
LTEKQKCAKTNKIKILKLNVIDNQLVIKSSRKKSSKNSGMKIKKTDTDKLSDFAVP